MRWGLITLVACSPAARPPSPAPPHSSHPSTAWIVHIPAPCRGDAPFTPIECPPAPPDPPHACIVEQRDLQTGIVVDRFVFVGARLLHHDETVSDIHSTSITYDYDDRDRLTRSTTCTTARAGDPGWFPPWRAPTVRHDSDYSEAERSERFYASPTSRVPDHAREVSTAHFDGKVVTDEMRYCYALDQQGRRLERLQIYRTSDQPDVVSTTVRTYTYGPSGVHTIRHATINERRAGTPSYQYGFSAVFTYDARHRMISVDSAGSTSRYGYDDHDRLAGYAGSVAFAWDDDRLVSMTGLGAGYDREYIYDANHRITEVRFGAAGYRVEYGVACPASFRHDAFWPGVDNFQYYEGKDTL